MTELFEYILIALACPLALLVVEPQESEEKKCTYKDTGCGSCKWQLDCPIDADSEESEG